MNVGGINDAQYERLEKSRKIKKYGHLETWKEIFLYQAQFATPEQRQEIIDWGSRQIRYRDVYLPLMNMVRKGGEENE